MSDLSKSERAMGQHIITLAREEGPELVAIEVDDDVEIDWDEWTVEEYDRGVTNDSDNEPYVEVEFRQESTQSEKVRSATRYPNSKAHPAEYKNHDVELIGVVQFYPERVGGFGECEGLIEQIGGRPSPPAEPF